VGALTSSVTVFEVKHLGPGTLDELAALLIHVVDDGASIGFLPPLSQLDAVDYWKDVIQPGVVLVVAQIDNKIAGTVQLHLAQKANSTHRAEIAKLMVHSESRRNGIAKLLMNEVEAMAVQAGRSLLVLDTRAGDPSNHLYQSLGYVEAGRIPKYARSADGELHETVLYYKLVG
jgi:ribosomal protein S18 acetylase RimI-like enzyme